MQAVGLPVADEVERALAVTHAIISLPGRRLHFAGDLLKVMLNLQRWNLDLKSESGAFAWGRRTVTYFVYDPLTRLFAPSKFCAYVLITG